MPISLYDASIPVMTRGLKYAATFLDLGRQFADTNGKEHSSLLEARLSPDMFTLIGQVQRFCDTAKNTVVRVAGVQNVIMPDNEKTFEEVQGRIAKVIEFLNATPASVLESRESAEVVLPAPGGNRTYTGASYVFEYALPNFYFHVTTAYDVLRNQGVPVGKRHFLGWSDKL